MKTLFLLGFSLSICMDLFCQERIDGFIIDNETKEPLVGATVVLRASHQGTVTNANGHFTLPATNADTLEVTYIGYDKKLIPNPPGNPVVFLAPSASNLQQIV